MTRRPSQARDLARALRHLRNANARMAGLRTELRAATRIVRTLVARGGPEGGSAPAEVVAEPLAPAIGIVGPPVESRFQWEEDSAEE